MNMWKAKYNVRLTEEEVKELKRRIRDKNLSNDIDAVSNIARYG